MLWHSAATIDSNQANDARRMHVRRRFCLILWLSLAAAVLAAPISSDAQIICISNNIPPPELPDYDQPPLPAPGYLWIPGYWAGGPNGYFWVPGTWELPPAAGLLWTPGYWGWRDGVYIWTAGYWGPHVGFYGGINYGFGYTGVGYEGGRWENGVFFYNRTVNNFVGVTITNVYEKTVVVDVNAPRVAFNGGSGGTTTRPTPQEEAAAREQRVATLPTQLQHERVASANKALLASENHGRPAIAATAKPGEFTGKGVVATKEPGTTPAVPAATRPSAAEPLNRAKEERPGEQRATTTPGMSAPSKPRETETEHGAPAAKPQSQSPPPKPSAQSAIKPAPSPPPPPSNPAPAAAKPAPPPPPPPSHP
ncbi:MAG TPA: YXWGXW repeat-containing protein, partial [Xanthobacteraceae bacterium]|nr:YXWGXW repeat-containing protein [Xanthobacteraceae bacterium]